MSALKWVAREVVTVALVAGCALIMLVLGSVSWVADLVEGEDR